MVGVRTSGKGVGLNLSAQAVVIEDHPAAMICLPAPTAQVSIGCLLGEDAVGRRITVSDEVTLLVMRVIVHGLRLSLR